MTYPFGHANLCDFQWFVTNVMKVPDEALPITVPPNITLVTAFVLAKDTVNPFIREVSPHYYNLAVYNWAGDYLINWAEDSLDDCSTFWAETRVKMKITKFVAGVVASTADESTSTSLEVPDAMKGLTFADLQLLKTPYGRMYLSIAQKMGSIWGIS